MLAVGNFTMVYPLLLAFILPFQLCISAQETVHPNSTSCPENFQCGSLGPLKFPFTSMSQPSCGLCPINCDFRPPKIKLSKNTEKLFEVKSMVQGNQIKLYDPMLQDHFSNQSCESFDHEINIPNSTSISFTILSNIMTLYKCSNQLNLSQEITEYFNKHGYRKYESCEDLTVYYGNPKYFGSIDSESPSSCPVTHLPMISTDTISEDTDLFQLLTANFEIEWHVSDECYHRCHLKGGQCETDAKSQFLCKNAKIGAGKNNSRIIIEVAAAAGGAILIVAIILIYFRRKTPFWGDEEKNQNVKAFLRSHGSLSPKRYNYSEVKKMTNAFKIMLGEGGYGSVYKGKLQDGTPVAVKVLKESNGNGEEFINEVASISKTSHVNIVTLLGFCFQGGKKALIYEYMANGSLEKFIYGKNSLVNRQLKWSTLYKIAVGIARGLEYLHRGCSTRILHFDIKPHNILLDEVFCPKIADFGLAKLCTRKESIISTMAARGTIGYIAPEVVCKNIGAVSPKSDVYSYGMMVLEIVGGRKNLDVKVDHASATYFPHWIYMRLNHHEDLGLSGIINEEDNEQARKLLMVSLWCIQTDPSTRPSMTSVVEMLEGNLQNLRIPPKPYLHSPPGESSVGDSDSTWKASDSSWSKLADIDEEL